MLPKKNRADRKAVDTVFKEGKFVNSLILSFKYKHILEGSTKISFTVPKSVAKLAVKRNLLRRHGYQVLKKALGNIPFPLLGIFIFKKDEPKIEVLEHEIRTIFNKIH